MTLSYFRTKVAALICAAILLVTLTPSPAGAAALPTLGTRLYWILGSVLFGGMIDTGSASANTTSVAGYMQVLPEFSSATTLKPVNNRTSDGFPYRFTFNAYVRGGTGSSTVRYAAACFENPFQNIGAGSGLVLRLDYHAGDTNGNGGDIGFVSTCTSNTSSGSDLIDNTCTASGCVSSYTTGTAVFHGAKFIKFTPRGKLGADGGRITGEVLNIRDE